MSDAFYTLPQRLRLLPIRSDIEMAADAIEEQAATIRQQAAEIERLREELQLIELIDYQKRLWPIIHAPVEAFSATLDKLHDVKPEIERLTDALKEIAKQKLTGEIDEDDIDYSDFPSAYDECVLCARAALKESK